MVSFNHIYSGSHEERLGLLLVKWMGTLLWNNSPKFDLNANFVLYELVAHLHKEETDAMMTMVCSELETDGEVKRGKLLRHGLRKNSNELLPSGFVPQTQVNLQNTDEEYSVLREFLKNIQVHEKTTPEV